MRSSQIITLFAEQPPPRRTPSTYLVSILLHGVGFGLLLAGLRRPLVIDNQPVVHRFTVRLLDPDRIRPQIARSAGSGGASAVTHNESHALAPGGNTAPESYVPPQISQLLPGAHTLVQPDAPPDLQLPKEVQIPALTMWSSEYTPVKKIVPPPPQEATAADVRPSFVKPNREPVLADVNVSSTAFVTEAPAPPASTTAPVFTRELKPIKQVPEMASTSLDQPTPARVISVSNVKTQAPVMIPLANQSLQTGSSGPLAPLRPEKVAGDGNRNAASDQHGAAAGTKSGDQTDKSATGSGSVAKSGTNSGSGQGAQAGAGQGPAVGNGPVGTAGSGLVSTVGSAPGIEPNVTHITVPKDGQFGVVVVGSSLAEEYPETVEIWNGRLIYSVYLHVGLHKNWILQYSLPRAEEAAKAGSIARPDAPWPYDMMRPNLAPEDFNSEAIMVHGFINLAGRFEKLSVVFPPEFAQAKFLLDALKQWQFRAARQNGQLAAVEVLLIIPEESAQ
jgi:hypothetical protein